MFDRLFDFIHDFFHLFQFWVIIDEYEEGVVKTAGVRRPRQKRWHFWRRKCVVLTGGFHFVFPLGIDEILVDNVVPCVDEFDEQSLTTKDGKSITLNVVVMWSIEDIEKILFDVEDADSAFEEAVCGIIGEIVESMTWEDIHGGHLSKVITKKVRQRVKKWGIKVHSIQFKNLTQSRAIRLL